jgi:GTPase SAR1 family protein
MTKSFVRDAAAAAIVVDITRRDSFNNVHSWLKEFRDVCGSADVIILANKTDLESSRKVTREELAKLGEDFQLTIYECSAKTGDGVDNAFQSLAQALVNK